MADENTQLESSADNYFRTLSGLKFPQALVDGHPRIANKIFELREKKSELREYFDSLASDKRGGRQGFAFNVLMNIQDLREVMVGDATGFVLDDTTKWVS
jgi:hypothetical protein